MPDTQVADAVHATRSRAWLDLPQLTGSALARSTVVRVLLLIGIVVLGAAVRLNVLRWDAPFTPHHPDEAILPLESMALWEGVTPREVGWPASTTRLLLSGTLAVQWAADWAGTRHDVGDAASVVDDVATWISARYVDSVRLFRTARGLMVAIGTLQLVALVWALRQWTGWTGTLLAATGAAIAPLAVSHSQFVLADMTGVLFATLIVGLAGRPVTMSRTLTMAALAALGACSKLHFGIWLLVPVFAVWFLEARVTTRVSLTLAAAAMFGGVLVALVPWLWLNPVLFAKEFAGVVLVKVVAGSASVSPLLNAWAILHGIGAITLAGAVLGLGRALQHRQRSVLAVVLPMVVALAALASSGIVFDRYGLVVMPALSLLAAIGWEAGWSARALLGRAAAITAFLIALVATSSDLIASQGTAGEPDVSLLASNWIVANVRPGARVARHDEDNTFLPRTREQLDSCVEGISGQQAYGTKLHVVGMSDRLLANEPMRAAVLNDELFQAYWCRRERTAAVEKGFVLIPYHQEPRYGAVLEQDAIAAFRARLAGKAETGPDVVVTNRLVDVGVAPAVTFRTSRGERVIYARPEARR